MLGADPFFEGKPNSTIAGLLAERAASFLSWRSLHAPAMRRISRRKGSRAVGIAQVERIDVPIRKFSCSADSFWRFGLGFFQFLVVVARRLELGLSFVALDLNAIQQPVGCAGNSQLRTTISLDTPSR